MRPTPPRPIAIIQPSPREQKLNPPQRLDARRTTAAAGVIITAAAAAAAADLAADDGEHRGGVDAAAAAAAAAARGRLLGRPQLEQRVVALARGLEEGRLGWRGQRWTEGRLAAALSRRCLGANEKTQA